MVATVFLTLFTVDARTIYVNNQVGKDSFDGSLAAPGEDGAQGPLKSLRAAFEKVQESGRIEIHNTGIPYEGGAVLSRVGGTPGSPLVIEGNGATLSGLRVVPEKKWTQVSERIYRSDFYPMSNRLKGHKDYPFWVEKPQVWWVNGEKGQNVRSMEDLEKTPGSFYWNKSEKAVFFHLPEGKIWGELQIMLPIGSSGLNLRDRADYVVVQNLRSMHSMNDGFSAHGNLRNIVFQNCYATDNCGQGFSMHGTVRALVLNSYAARNASSGSCDVNQCQVTYIGTIFEDNSFEAGVYSTEETVTMYENCLILGNQPFEQIWQVGQGRMLFFNSIIANRDTGRASALISDGRVVLMQCTVVSGGPLAIFDGRKQGILRLDHTLVAAVGGEVFGKDQNALQQIEFLHTILPADASIIQGEGGLQGETLTRDIPGIRLETISLEGRENLEIPAAAKLEKAGERYKRPTPIGATLPEDLWKRLEEGRKNYAAPEQVVVPQ